MLYKPEDLVGKQVICCTNLNPIHIGDITSDVRILGTESEQGVVLLTPSEKVENGIQSCCILVNTSFQTPCVQCSILISMSYLWAKVVKKLVWNDYSE